MLITSRTRDSLTRPLPLISRGTVPLKGKAALVEALAAAAETREAAPRRPSGEATALTPGD